jgi:hypothetical protein
MDTHSLLVYLFLTVVFGGGAATLMGRNFATNWRPLSNLVLAGLGLALGVRFLHYALFWEPLVDVLRYALDAVVVVAMALVGYRWRRTEQMTSQYFWLYERTGPLTWRQKSAVSQAPEG